MCTGRRSLFTIVAAFALLLAACGGSDGNDRAEAPAGAVEIEMVDISFEPDDLAVEQGETVTFWFVNNGEAVHDAFIGDSAAQDEHEREMREADEGHGAPTHDGTDEDAITVDPGDAMTFEYTFDETGTVEIGCHQPGHYEAGMKVEVTVT